MRLAYHHFTARAPACLARAWHAGWLLLAVLTPLLINPWGQQPFELPRAAFVRSLVWLLAALGLGGAILARRPLWREARAGPLAGPVALLALVLAATTATAADVSLSLWGSYDRAQGALTWLTYLLLLLLAAHYGRSWRRARRLVAALAVPAAPLILLGLSQAAGLAPFGLVSDARSPVFATLGRSNFLGAYLALLAPLTLALGLTDRGPWRRALWTALLSGELLVIGLTLARSAWLATAAGLGLFALLWWGPRLSRLPRRLAWLGLGTIALAGPAIVLLLGERLGGAVAARRLIWEGVFRLIAERPLLGYGADALGLAFPRVYPPALVYAQGRDFFVDRAHNLVLDWAAVAGLPGLLAYALVVGAFALALGRALRGPLPPARRALLAAIGAAVFGQMVNNLLSFDVTATATATWLLMGLGAALAARRESPAVAALVRETGAHPSLWRPVLAGLLVVGGAVAVWQGNVRPVLADGAARRAHLAAGAGDWARAVAAAEEAVARWPAEPAHHLLLSRAYGGRADAGRAEAALLEAIRRRPGDPSGWWRAAEFYTAAGRHPGLDHRGRADAAYRRAVGLAPNQAALYAAWGRALLEGGDPAAAAVALRRAVALDASHGEAYLYLGAAELALGRVEVALADYREAARLLPDAGAARAGIAQALRQLARRP